MKIAVIAANGRTGQEFIKEALMAGHTINAGVHNHTSLKASPVLNVMKCDARDIGQVKDLIDGADAVASFIGHNRNSDPEVQTKAIAVLEKAMADCGMKRVISLTGTGIRFPGDKISLIDRILNLSISIIDPKRIKDGKTHVELLKNSQLDWTIIRVLKLQNIKPRDFKLTPNGPTKIVVGRSEVALAALQVLENKSFIGKAPIISKP